MAISDIVKKVRQEQDRHVQGDARRFTVSFGGVVRGQEGKIFVVASGVSLPHTYLVHSEPHTGPVPHDAVVFDQEALAAYEKANQKRPAPAAPVLLTETDIKQQKKWSDAQWKVAVLNGFPKPTGAREICEDGIPVRRDPLWHAEVVTTWDEAHAALR